MTQPYIAWADASCNGAVALADAAIFLSGIGTVSASNALLDIWGPSGLADGVVSLADVSKVLAAVGGSQFDATGINYRNKYLWPFASTSIWNMPLARGNEAHFVAAGLTTVDHVGADENIIINSPASTPIAVWHNDVGWDSGTYGQNNLWQYRLRTDSGVGGSSDNLSLPWPNAYLLPGGDFAGDSPNFCTAIVNDDGLGITQLQPATHGSATGSAPSSSPTNTITEFDLKADIVDLKADDTLSAVKASYGAQGGSGMSAMGGCIRIGELTPANTNGFIRHALKIEGNAEQYYSDHDYSGSGGGVGFRWPATSKDSGVTQSGSVAAMTYGSLLALKTNFVVKNLTTEPARIIARTLMRYGAYVVDSSSATNVFTFCTERGPAGRVCGPPDPGATGPEEFALVWANQPSSGNQGQAHGFGDGDQQWNGRWPEWQADMATIIKALFVVDNNAPTTIGGPTIAGTWPALRLAPPAPAFSN